MIKFFSKIRQRLLTENKFSKYLLYAVGEIVLVVIGILIALSINNWNEDNKDRKAETQSFINLKTEFKNNHMRLLRLIKIRKKNENKNRAYIEMITNDTVPLLKKIRTKIPQINASLWNPNYPILKSLLSSGEIKKIQNDSLKIMLMNWNFELEVLKEFDNSYLSTLKQKHDYLNENMYGSIVMPENNDDKWIGYYPNDISDKLDAQMTSIINDMTYYNHNRDIIINLYTFSSKTKNLVKLSDKIMSNIDFELKNRTK